MVLPRAVYAWKFWLLCLLCYCGLIWFLSNQPALPVPQLFHMQDKLIHAGAYAVMAWLLWHAGRGYLSTPMLAVTAVVVCSLFGVTDEWHQYYVSGRQADVYDWLADTVGALLLTMVLYRREFVNSTGGSTR